MPITSADWDFDGFWATGPAIPREAALTPPELEDVDGPDAPDEHVTRRPGYREALERDGVTILPVSGGAPEPIRPFGT